MFAMLGGDYTKAWIPGGWASLGATSEAAHHGVGKDREQIGICYQAGHGHVQRLPGAQSLGIVYEERAG